MHLKLRVPDHDDVVALCGDLLRIDTSNPGPGELAAAVYVRAALEEAGGAPELLEAAPGRASVLCRVAGSDPALPGLLVHGHLDVVHADPAGWTYPPFAGVEAHGCLWGRGALDMKGFIAAMVMVQRDCLAGRLRPRRDIVFAYLADEEMAGELGSRWLVEQRPDLLSGVAEAIGETGGFRCRDPDGGVVYPVAVGERSLLWLRVRVPGRLGHAAFAEAPNPVSRLARILAELEAGPGQRFRIQPTFLSGGGKYNVIPGSAEAVLDCRPEPGQADAAIQAVRAKLEDDVELEVITRTEGTRSPADAPIMQAFGDAVRSEDPAGQVRPYLFPAGSDATKFVMLGIRCYGFTPLVLPDDFPYWSLFHAVDERVPVDALRRGSRILRRFLASY